MTRGHLSELPSPHPLLGYLPELYQAPELYRALRPANGLERQQAHGDFDQHHFLRQLLGVFDEILAPVFGSLDNLAAYLDPALTPDDFLDWLAGWVGVSLDESWPIERRRALVAVAAQLYRTRGTVAGLAAHLRLATGAEVEVADSGGAAWSQTAGADPPGSADFSVLVKLKARGRSRLDTAKLEKLVAAAKPAHVVHSIEIVRD